MSMLAISASSDPALISVTAEHSDLPGEWLYLATAPFYSLVDNILLSDLQTCWSSGAPDSGAFDRIFVSSDTHDALTLMWGIPSPDCISELDENEISSSLWKEPNAVAILPFEAIGPSYKILQVNGMDPLAPDFSAEDYPLKLQFFYHAPPDLAPDLITAVPLTNFNSSLLTSVALTGVTALVRDTAVIMDEEGITYPAIDVRDILTSADITHISNEVPFAVDCPPPQSSQDSLRFCSADSYMQLLIDVGTDIVELSGDHLGDWGPEAMLHTMDLYQENNLLTYGGGRNLQEGLDPVFIDHNGNRFAFIGCNGKSPDRYASATATNPGAARCDFDWMIPEIQQLSSAGYIVIATMQHEEVDSFGSIALQRYDFRRLAEAGAVIVSGSQAHHPQAFEYTGDSFIHYGLGNLFFDQWYLAKHNPEVHANEDKSFIDLHYFYDGKYIGTRLIPLQFIDNARPRPMTTEESSAFLGNIYQYSLWDGKWVYLFPAGYYTNGN